MNFYDTTDGNNGITRAVKLWAGELYVERAVQHFYHFKLSCGQKQTKEANEIELSVNSTEFWPQRTAAVIVTVKMKEQMED